MAMETLRRLFEGLDLKDVETFIASGNVIFKSPSRDPQALCRRIEGELRASLGYEVATFIRTQTELEAIVRYRPFRAAQLESSASFNVAFLAEPLDAAAQKSLLALKTAIDDFHVYGRELYWLCKKKQSDSKFSYTRFEKMLNARATWRNVNTVARLVAKYSRPPDEG